MQTTEQRRAQNRESQARFRAKSKLLLEETRRENNIVTGLAAAVRRAVDHGRVEFRPILHETDEQTVLNLAEFLYQVPAQSAGKSPKLGKRSCAE